MDNIVAGIIRHTNSRRRHARCGRVPHIRGMGSDCWRSCGAAGCYVVCDIQTLDQFPNLYTFIVISNST